MSEIKQKESIDPLIENCSSNKNFFKGYLEGNFQRIHADYQLIHPYIKDHTRILDIGAIPPLLGQFVRESGQGHYTVLDPDPNPFRDYLDTDRSSMIEGDISKRMLRVGELQYDLVLLNEVIEHVSGNLIRSIQNALSFLKPGGYILVTTPNLRSIWGLYALMVCSSGLASKPNQSVRKQYERAKSSGYFGHIREYTEKEVVDLMLSFGLNHVSSNFQADYRAYSGFKAMLVSLERFFPKWRLFGKYIFQKPTA